MRNIAVFYHCILENGAMPINTDWALSIMIEQMEALKQSGLLAVTTEMIVGMHGSDDGEIMARSIIPSKATIVRHPSGLCTEIPTLALLRSWLPGHDDWYVMYHHIKAVMHTNNERYATWRRRLENAVVWNWRDCVMQMDHGIDSCGAHWLTPEAFPGTVLSPFWGGTFWWATAKFLRTLPPLPPAVWSNRHEAENWIGRGPRRPRVRDYFPGFPQV